MLEKAHRLHERLNAMPVFFPFDTKFQKADKKQAAIFVLHHLGVFLSKNQ